MEKKVPQHLHHILFWIILALLFFLSFQIIRPYLIPLVSAFVLAYLIQPLYLLFVKRMNKTLAAILALVIPLLLLIIPFALIANSLVHQILSAATSGSVAQIIQYIQSSEIITSFNINLQDIQGQFFSILFEITKNMLAALPTFIIGCLITLLGAYYILINWASLSSALKSYLPFPEKERVAQEMSETTDRIIRGYVLIALLEFVIAFMGFMIAGVDYFILFPFLIAVLAFIPLLGPGLIWIPLTLFYFATGNMYTGTIILITGLIISVLIDGFVAAKIVGDHARIHPLLMFIGILGGIPIFGIFGMIIGPLVLLYTLKLVQESINARN